MARSDVLLESLVGYYSTLGMDAVGLWRAAREDLRTESLDWKRATSRMATWWSDAFEGLWSAVLVSGAPPLPTLFLSFRADSDTHSNFIRISVPGRKDPEITSLARVGSGEDLAGKVKVEVTHFRDQITLTLSELDSPKPGTYQAIIHLDEQPLVLVVVDIQGNGANGRGKRNARRRKAARRGRKAAKKPARKALKKPARKAAKKPARKALKKPARKAPKKPARKKA